jgi:hypothetical protein
VTAGPMASESPCLTQYLSHLAARLRAHSRKGQEPLPDCVNEISDSERLALVVDALQHVKSPNLVHAVGDGLLEHMLNDRGAALSEEITTLLRTNQRFRFAFSCGTHASVDPSLIDEWLEVLRELGTTKQAERKRLWSARGGLDEA